MPNLNVDGVNLYYFRAGEGVPIVFLHSWQANHHLWVNQLFTFATTNKVIAPDLRGTGESDKPKSGYSISNYAADLRAILDAEKIDRAILVGNSIGGVIALQFNTDYPDRVIGNVIISSPMRTSPKGLEEADPEWKRAYKKDFYTEFGKVIPDTFSARTLKERPELLATKQAWLSPWNFPEHVFWGGYDEPGGLFTWSAQDRLKAIDKPTVYFAGTEDTGVPGSEGEFLCSQVANSEIRVRENVGHHYQTESPNEFNKELREIVDRFAKRPLLR